mgnify:CR=1 FL=1
MKKRLLTIPSFLLLSILVQAQLSQLGKDPDDAVIKAMTKAEKVRLIMGLGFEAPGSPSTMAPPDTAKIPNPVDGSAGITYAIPRLGIPAIVLADGAAGLRINPTRPNENATYYCTAFPIGTLLASTWDPETVRKVGYGIGSEVKEYGADILLAPAINLHRNPLGGRNFEYYSEDPVVAGNIAAAYINGVQENGVGTSIKHFAANNHETNRTKIDVQVSQRALRELYLRSFEIALAHCNPWTVMSSYNKINGTYTSQSYDLISTILQKEWKYKGLVMTDWFAGDDGAAQMRAGNHMIMPGTKRQKEQIEAALADGSLSMEVLDANVKKVLELIKRTPSFNHYKYSNKPNLAGNAAISRAAATQGFVLLKNEKQSLPLVKPVRKIALFGNCSYHTLATGSGTGDVHKAYTISIEEGLKKIFSLDETLKQEYDKYLSVEEKKLPKPNFFTPKPLAPERPVSSEEAGRLAQSADVAIFTIGRISGEFADRKMEADYNLTDAEKQSLSAISNAFHAQHKKFIILMNVCGVMEMKSWHDLADAILVVWQPGQEAGNAVADVISGKVNPSGKLATSIVADYNDIPSSAGFPGAPAQNPEKVVYNEDIFTGYRAYEKDGKQVLYPFGFGLSYTSFNYSNLRISDTRFSGDKITITADIKNTGKAAGKEVVELYLAAPNGAVSKPLKELKAFVKTGLLQPGQKQTVSFALSKKEIASFSEAASAWVADAGSYKLLLGTASNKILVQGSFTLDRETIVEKVNDVLKKH